jgi:hypothetical protein
MRMPIRLLSPRGPCALRCDGCAGLSCSARFSPSLQQHVFYATCRSELQPAKTLAAPLEEDDCFVRLIVSDAGKLGDNRVIRFGHVRGRVTASCMCSDRSIDCTSNLHSSKGRQKTRHAEDTHSSRNLATKSRHPTSERLAS